jgi:hypothetical protein
MEIKSRRFIIAILVGMLVGLAITIYLQPACVGAVISVIVSAYLARAASPKDGAIVGAITLVPIGTYLGLWAILQVKATQGIGLPGAVFNFLLTLILASAIGALYGLVIGLLLRIAKERMWIR